MHFDWAQRISTVSGMILVLMLQIESSEIVKTVILAATGGVTSYVCTLLIKILLIRLGRRFKK